ncbi:MAG: sigma-54-dependent transcriptional regulator [Alkalispirochaeta sp.]
MLNKTARVLCIDDEPQMLNTYRRTLRAPNLELVTAGDGATGLQKAKAATVDVVLLDLKMPGDDGLTVLQALKALEPPPDVVIVTGHGSVSAAVEAMKHGAADFIEKPFSSEQLRHRVSQLIRIRELQNENDTLTGRRNPSSLFPEIIGQSAAIADIKTTIAQLAQTDVPVMILGESGTGKELVARALHDGGPRGDKPFVVVDCGSIPESMIESELFGHRKGAFTGALSNSPGLFRSAHGGTLFLDEIAELPVSMQTRLLRSVQNGEVRPVGSAEPVQVNVRIVAATNANIHAAVAERRFREDLFYRLTAVVLHVPALRDHAEDIPELVHHFLHRLESKQNRTLQIEPDVLETLTRHHWPGNVRELENTLAGAASLSQDGVIRVDTIRLPAASFDASPVQEVRESANSLAGAKDAAVDRALAEADGNKRQAAAALGVAESTIYRNLKRRGLL